MNMKTFICGSKYERKLKITEILDSWENDYRNGWCHLNVKYENVSSGQ